MKKRVLAVLLGAFVVINTLSLGSVARANNSEETVVTEESAAESSESSAEEVSLSTDEQAKESQGEFQNNPESSTTEEQVGEEPKEQTGDNDESLPEEGQAKEGEPKEDEPIIEVVDAVQGETSEIQDEAEESEDLDAEETEEEEDEQEDDKEPFSKTITVGGVEITLWADVDVLPEGAYFKATEIKSKSDIEAIESAVESELPEDKIITEVKAFDITIFDANGNEIQPANGKVKVTFANIDTSEVKADDSKDMQVFHLDDGMNNAEKVDASLGADKVVFNAEHFSPYVVVSVEDNGGSTEGLDENALIETAKLYKVVGGEKVPIKSGEAVSLKDTLHVDYVFNNMTIAPKGQEKHAGNDLVVHPGERYKIPGIPNICIRTDAGGITVKSGDLVLGEINFDSEGNAFLTISDAFTELEDSSEAYAGFDLQLNLDEEADAGQDSYELAFGDKAKYNIKVDEFMAKPPTVKKEQSTIDDEGVITWTVSVKNNKNPIQYKDGYTFKDTFSAGQDYVKNSFKVISGGDDATATNSGNTLTWTYKNNEPEKELVFQYQTVVDFIDITKDATSSQTVKKSIGNSIQVSAPATADYDKLDIKDSQSQQINRTVNSWVAKSGGEVKKVKDSDGKVWGVADWTVEVQNNGFNLKNVVLTDTIKVADGVEVEVTDLKVVDASNNNVVFEKDPSSTADVQILNLGDMAGNATYTVTYKTRIKDFDKYLKKNYPIPENSANITYEYESKGKGKDVQVVGPTIKKPFSGDLMSAKAAIEKKAKAVDLVNHTITWDVIVNRSKEDLSGVVVTDKLPAGTRFDGISGLAGISESAITIEDNGETVVFRLGDIGETRVDFVVTTKLNDTTENEIWASNNSRKYTNEVTLESDGNEPVKDQASKTYESNVLKKTASKYNYNDHTIEYTLTVNSNKMSMTNVVITDVLEDRLEYVNGSSNVADTTLSGNTLTFNLGDIDDVQTITFKAKVRDGEVFENTGKFNITNSASLKSTEYSIDTTTEPTQTEVVNNVITKKGVQDSTNKEIVRYTVKINPAQQQLYTGTIDKVYIEDTLGGSMVLDDETIVLSEASVSADGELSAVSAVSDLDYTIDETGSKTVLKVAVPKDPGNKAYILTYTASMLDKKANDFGNDVVLKGYGDAGANKADQSFSANDFTNVKLDKYTYYISELRDANDEEVKLSGGKFELYDPEKDNKLVGKSESDENGEIMFVGKLAENHTYILKETEAPEGYEIIPELRDGKEVHTTVKGYNNAVQAKNDNIITNGRHTKGIKIYKEDGQGNPVKDAKLSIKWEATKETKTADSWTTLDADSQGHEFVASYETVYTLSEDKVPYGYNEAEPVIFKVVDDQLMIRNADNTWTNADKVVMIDVPKDAVEFNVSNVSADQKNELEGGTFKIVDEDGNQIGETWTSNGAPKPVVLSEGKYKVIEVSSPVGYKEITDEKAYEIEVLPGGKLKVDGTILDSENPTVTFEDDYDEDAKASVVFDPEDMGLEPEQFKAMKFNLYRLNKETGKAELVEPTDYDEETGAAKYDLNYQDEYVFMPEETLEGYDPVEPLTIKVVGKENGEGDVVNDMKVKSASSPEYASATPAQLGEKLQPKLTPEEPVVPVEPEEPADPTDPADPADPTDPATPEEPKKDEAAPAQSTNGGGNNDNNGGPAKTQYPVVKSVDPDGLIIKENDIVMMDNNAVIDGTNANAGAPRLAKTGGFIGTVMAYVISLAIMGLGFVLLFGRRKNIKK